MSPLWIWRGVSLSLPVLALTPCTVPMATLSPSRGRAISRSLLSWATLSLCTLLTELQTSSSSLSSFSLCFCSRYCSQRSLVMMMRPLMGWFSTIRLSAEYGLVRQQLSEKPKSRRFSSSLMLRVARRSCWCSFSLKQCSTILFWSKLQLAEGEDMRVLPLACDAFSMIQSQSLSQTIIDSGQSSLSLQTSSLHLPYQLFLCRNFSSLALEEVISQSFNSWLCIMRQQGGRLHPHQQQSATFAPTAIICWVRAQYSTITTFLTFIMVMEQPYQLDPSLDSYIAALHSYGIWSSPKLLPAVFRLKNGLPYPGLLTAQPIQGEEELVRVPVSLLLTAHRALKEPALASVFSEPFYREGPVWQDRILITFLLHTLANSKEGIWLEMVRHFSRDIDIVSFWGEEEYGQFLDATVGKAARKQRAHFEAEWSKFALLQSEHEVLSNREVFSKQNYKWIYVHAISRCFGSFLGSTYFTPFCQLFNHAVVDVSYCCVKQPRKVEKTTPPIAASEEEKKQGEQSQSEVSSGYSQDYISDDDFDYMSIGSYKINWFSKPRDDLNPKEEKRVDKAIRDIEAWMDSQLEWKGFTLIYLGQIIEKVRIIENEYRAGRRKYHQTISNAEEVNQHLHTYRRHLASFYRSQGRVYQKIKGEKGAAYPDPHRRDQHSYEKAKEEQEHGYSLFKMEAREEARFEANSQVYFCYGKLSNRTLLVRYGFALEDNLYEHVWVKFRMGKDIEPYPDLFEAIQEKGLSVTYKVKLKAYTMALEPILLMRMRRWKLTHHGVEHIFSITDLPRQIQDLSTVKEVYWQMLSLYGKAQLDLTDREVGYHEYWARVYNKDKKKILEYQIRLIESALQLLVKLQQKQTTVKQVSQSIDEKDRRAMKHYWKGLKGLCPL